MADMDQGTAGFERTSGRPAGPVERVAAIITDARATRRASDPEWVVARLAVVSAARREVLDRGPRPAGPEQPGGSPDWPRFHQELSTVAAAFEVLGDAGAAVATLGELVRLGPAAGTPESVSAPRMAGWLRLAELHRAADDTDRAAEVLLARDALLAGVPVPAAELRERVGRFRALVDGGRYGDEARSAMRALHGAVDLDVLEERVRGAAALAGPGGRTAEARAILEDVTERTASPAAALGLGADVSRPWHIRRDAARALAGIDAREGRHSEAGWSYVALARAEEAAFLREGYLSGAWRRSLDDRMRAMDAFRGAGEWKQVEREARTVLHSVAKTERLRDPVPSPSDRRLAPDLDALHARADEARQQAGRALAESLARQGAWHRLADAGIAGLDAVPTTPDSAAERPVAAWRRVLGEGVRAMESFLAAGEWQEAEREARTVLHGRARAERLQYQHTSPVSVPPELEQLREFAQEAELKATRTLVLALARQDEWDRVAEAARDVVGLDAVPAELRFVERHWRLRPAPDDEDVAGVLERLRGVQRKRRDANDPNASPGETTEAPEPRQPPADLRTAVATAAASRGPRTSTPQDRARARRARLTPGRRGEGRSTGR
ncbi:hypothetical protein [Marinitenerispora sediminis]|uniref:Uncharacterized protein n=1 Tax=Marinitenerispora sediminis TaxID=1931232 RepID=A0A368T5W9_9ACTN|nr:hypothetical protein [Marinitenerispora sediminis]RCV49879.1 hypothetical protein DEF28_19635 [Marinitenerispora sediminis]RCV51472.1 hypothetical protein DEF23_20350 [Marinitenerispora sediminis]RCV55226.1 hypothetical protein DEF24_18195 [Marinitenerispora sediminis]